MPSPPHARRRRRRSRPALPLLAVALAACGGTVADGSVSTPARRLERLSPKGGELALAPGERRRLAVRYADASGRAIRGGRVHFAIFGDPAGSTLSTDVAATDASGRAEVAVTAGPQRASFQVRAAAAGAREVRFTVVVSDAGFWSLGVRASYQGRHPATALTRVDHYLATGDPCASGSAAPPSRYLFMRRVTNPGTRVVFEALPVRQAHGVVTVAADAYGKPLAHGCLALPASLPHPRQRLEVTVPLRDIDPLASGTYAVVTTLSLPASPAAAAALAPWRDLGDCALDPAEALLDCVVDALDAGDPLDCRPGPPGTTARAVAARRGTTSAGCRGPTTLAGGTSLEATLRARMLASGGPILSALPGLGTSIAGLLRRIELASLLVLPPLASGAGAATHRLTEVRLFHPTRATRRAISLARHLAPVLERRDVAVTRSGWRIAIGAHAFTLRPGRLVEEGARRLVLEAGGLPGTASGLAAAIAGLVTDGSGSLALKGCPAVDAIVCRAAGLTRGCLGGACDAGVKALGARLAGSFTALDAAGGEDLRLAGSGTATDADGDRKTEAIGAKDGLWSTATVTFGKAAPLAATKATFRATRR